MMKLKANLTAAILMALAVALVLAGCDNSVPLDASRADKVVLTYSKGGMVVTDAETISNLVEAVKCAKVDNTPYDTAMTLKIDFFAGDTNLATVSAGPPLFRLGKTQYYDRTGRFMETMRTLTERSKTPNQAPEDTARKLADPQR